MNKTKRKILDAARELFNSDGYGQVTIRMIAIELGISSGNLNYHFKKREEILEHLYFEMVEDFDQRIETLADVEISLVQIHHDMSVSMERMLKYKFIWTDLFHILNVNDKIRAHFHEVYQKRIAGNVFLFEKLRVMELLRPSRFTDEYELLAERMVAFGDTWIYTSEVYDRINSPRYLKHQAKRMLVMLYPYFTPKGIQEFENAFPEWFQ